MRRLVFDNYQRCPVSLIEKTLTHFKHHPRICFQIMILLLVALQTASVSFRCYCCKYCVEINELTWRLAYIMFAIVVGLRQASTFSFKGASPLGLKSSKKERGTKANWKGTQAIFKPLFVDDYVILSTDFKMVVNFPTHIYFIVAVYMLHCRAIELRTQEWLVSPNLIWN